MLLTKREEVDLNELLKIVIEKINREITGTTRGYISKESIKLLVEEKRDILKRMAIRDEII